MMAIDRSSLPNISENVKQFWQPQRTDYSSGGIAYCNAKSNDVLDVNLLDPNPATFADLTDLSGFNHRSCLALISTHGGKRWQLPKGTVEPRESSIQTALREVQEETGLMTKLESFVETVEYWYWDTYNRTIPVLVHKRVDFYLLPITGGELSDQSFEVDAVAWFTARDALRKMTFKAEKETLQRALKGQY